MRAGHCFEAFNKKLRLMCAFPDVTLSKFIYPRIKILVSKNTW